MLGKQLVFQHGHRPVYIHVQVHDICKKPLIKQDKQKGVHDLYYNSNSHNIKFLKVQWSHHSEKEATWEREDRLRLEYPTFFPEDSKSRDEILLSGGELSHPS